MAVSKSAISGLQWILSDTAKDYDRVTLRIASTLDLSADIVSELWDTSTKIWNTPIGDWGAGMYFATFVAEKDGMKYAFTVILSVTE